MKYLFLLIPFLSCHAIDDIQPAEESIEPIYCIYKPEPVPTFPGGFDALGKYVTTNFNWKNVTRCVEGKVFVSFIIDEYGNVIDPEVLMGIAEEYDHEVIRIFRQMPKWNPAIQSGKPIRIRMVYPVRITS